MYMLLSSMCVLYFDDFTSSCALYYICHDRTSLCIYINIFHLAPVHHLWLERQPITPYNISMCSVVLNSLATLLALPSSSLFSNYYPEHTSYNSPQPYHMRIPQPPVHPWCTSWRENRILDMPGGSCSSDDVMWRVWLVGWRRVVMTFDGGRCLEALLWMTMRTLCCSLV